MKQVLILSALAGMVWNVIAMTIMGWSATYGMMFPWLLAAILASLAAGRFTIWSRIKTDGAETLRYIFATYYLGMVVYWAGFVIIQRTAMCVRNGGWTDFNLHDHLVLIVWMAVLGTVVWGILLIPLTILTRHLIWKTYLRNAE